MGLVPPPGARAPARLAFCAAALAALAACTMPPPLVAAAPAPVADPVLRAVAAASPGAPVAVGGLAVTITADYISAEGQECRAYTVEQANGAASQGLACNNGAAWHKIPPLTPGDSGPQS